MSTPVLTELTTFVYLCGILERCFSLEASDVSTPLPSEGSFILLEFRSNRQYHGEGRQRGWGRGPRELTRVTTLAHF